MATGTPLAEGESIAASPCALLLDRLRALIAEENRALAAAQPVDFDAIATRKNQLLRNLLIVQRDSAAPHTLAALAPKIRELQCLLRRNRRLLGLHIAAVKQVSAIIVDSLRHADSDGTYSRQRRT